MIVENFGMKLENGINFEVKSGKNKRAAHADYSNAVIHFNKLRIIGFYRNLLIPL